MEGDGNMKFGLGGSLLDQYEGDENLGEKTIMMGSHLNDRMR
jgi:hypothetical protein